MAWEASDRICGKRLQPLLAPLIEATERHGHAGISSGAREQLLAMSPATIDRALRETRISATGPRRRKPRRQSGAAFRSAPSLTGITRRRVLSRLIWYRTLARSPKGPFTQTLVLTDIASG